jgi:hypothetical protein
VGRRGFSRGSRWWWAVGLLFLLAIAAALVFAASLSEQDLDRADKLASVASLVTGVAALLVGGVALWLAIRQDTAKPVADDEANPLGHAADRLADAVRRQWRQEADLRRLRRPQPIRVRWSSTARPVSAHPEVVLGKNVVPGRPTRLKLSGDLHTVRDAFLRLPARQLVVLGEPGAGKTVLAILFTLDVLEARADDEPVPVLLSLASWHPTAEHLHTWLARRLVEDYPDLAGAGPDIATRLIDGGRLIPVLDGLDEMPPALHDEAIEGLDRAMSDGGPLIVTCRTTEYESAVMQSGRFLSRAAVVEIDSVDVPDTIEFLTAAQPADDGRWRPVTDHLRADPGGPLAKALSTPLMVYLARTAYARPSTDPAELCDADRFQDHALIEEHLLTAYLPSVYAPLPTRHRARDARRYSAAQAHRWLTFLATHLHRHETRDLAWWHLHQALPRRAAQWVACLVLGLTDGLVCAVAIGVGLGPGGFVAGLLGAFLSGFLAGLIAGPPARPRRVNTELPGRGRAGRRLAVGVAAALGVGVAAGVTIGVTAGIAITATVGAAIGITAGAAIAVLVGFTRWLNAPADSFRSPSPISVLRGERTVSCVQMCLAVFGIPLTVGLVGSAVDVYVADVLVGATVGLAAGVVAGIGAGLVERFAASAGGVLFVRSPWGWSLLSRCWLALAGRLPWRLMAFLADAHQRGVLRQAGAVYQFRHARLQDHLAS